ncbi:hypothetical protein ACNHUS_06265 [Actinomycetes bacterium M1A6_2h]
MAISERVRDEMFPSAGAGNGAEGDAWGGVEVESGFGERSLVCGEGGDLRPF